MHLKDIQQLIAEWGVRTFGKAEARDIATRMNAEVAELLIGLNHIPPAGLDREEAIKALGMECADIGIMLVQVAARLGIDLETFMEQKMEINRNRKWGVQANGKVQHVSGSAAPVDEEPFRLIRTPGGDLQPHPDVKAFREEGSGLAMDMTKFYVVWDAGGVIFPDGHPTPEDAYARCAAGGYKPVEFPTYEGWGAGWSGQGGINILAARDLYLFWAALAKEHGGDVQITNQGEEA